METNKTSQDSKKTPTSITLSLMTILPKGSSFVCECTTADANSYKQRHNASHFRKNKIQITTEKVLIVDYKTLQTKNACKINIV